MQALFWKFFFPAVHFELLLDAFLLDTTSKDTRVGPTGLQGAVEGVLPVSDGLDSPRVSNCEVSM